MIGVFLAERTVLAENKSIRIVLFVLNAVVVSLLAFGAFKSDFSSCRFGCHIKTPYKKITPLVGACDKFTTFTKGCQSFLKVK